MEQHEYRQAQQSETVLVLQGGGSLGAYKYGVYKMIAKHDIKFDILAGSSIGAINSSIICSIGSKRVCYETLDGGKTLSEKVEILH